MGSSILPGERFLLKIGSVPHYFFVISASDHYPSEPLVLVSMTKQSKDKHIDDACVLNPGDHPCCSIPSYVDYARAQEFTPGEMEQLICDGRAVRNGHASPALLKRLRDGADASDFLKDRVRETLWRQGLASRF